MSTHKNILNDPEVQAAHLTPADLEVFQTITDAVGNHQQPVRDLIKEFTKEEAKHGDLTALVLQTVAVMDKYPAFAEKFATLMNKLAPIGPTHPIMKHLKK